MTQPVQEPTQGRVDAAQNWRTSQLFRRPGPPVVAVTYAIKVTGDDESGTTGNGKFYLPIRDEFNDWFLVGYTAAQSDLGINDSVIGLSHQPGQGAGSYSVLTQDIVIQTYFPFTEAVIDDTLNQVAGGYSMLRVDYVDVTGAKGIEVEITLAPTNRLL